MQSRFRVKGILVAALLVMIASAMFAPAASAGPEPGAKPRGFRLFARALGAYTINRVYCGLAADGRVCVDSTGSSTIGGGFWPKGTADQYIFNSGLQIAGIIGPDGGTWAGDTTGAFFFDPKGTTQHGEQVEPIYNFQNPSDAASWPEAACVPNGDSTAALFNPLLQTDASNTADPTCRKTASEGDIWFVSWEGDPTLKAGRKHPLGIMVETRAMGWNTPADNKDISYYIFTFYNVTSLNAADYALARPKIRPLLLQQAQTFHTAEAAQGVTIPQGGYTLTNLFAAFATDMDVAQANANYASVNLPFALGFTYDHGFEQPGAWTFDPTIFAPPFFPGVGFAGTKYLKSPTGAGVIQLYSNTINGTPFAGAFNDPQNTTQLWRYLSGNINQAAGDQACNTGNPALTHVCFINNNSPQDMRYFQSSTSLTLPPGAFGSIAVAYIFAAPVATGGCSGNCDVVASTKPGNPLKLVNRDSLAVGANLVDSLTGFRGWQDLNHDSIPEQPEFTVVKGSLLGKALTAQAVFDAGFLRPFAPTSPDFFLIPGDNQVTVLWQPSTSDPNSATPAPDPFFQIASQPQILDPQGHLVPNFQYDPNYRQFDVEGYRIYRGRVDSPSELTLLAQFDYSGTTFVDFTGQVNPTDHCAIEFGVRSSCPVPFDSVVAGTAPTHSISYPIVGDLIQVALNQGARLLLANGSVVNTKLDTAVVGGSIGGPCAPSACPPLKDTGVPFSYVDRTPLNSFRYFYSVTAFDINSIQSAPSSLESPRITKSVTPVHLASNYSSNGVVALHVVGRGVAMDTIIKNDPGIDATKGTFSGPQRPANGLIAAFVGQLASQVLNGTGGFSVSLDSISATGEADESSCCGAVAVGSPTTYYLTAQSGSLVTHLQLPIQLDGNDGGSRSGGQKFFSATTVDSALSGLYGGNKSFQLQGTAADTIPSIYLLNAQSLGCRIGGGPITGSGTPGTNCMYNGPRWFTSAVGPTASPLISAREGTETFADPNSGNCPFPSANDPTCAVVSFNNAGALTGVTTVYTPMSYVQLIRRWRNVESSLAPYYRAADINVYWGTAGKIDSVIDITHNLPIPSAFKRDSIFLKAGVPFDSVVPAYPVPLNANWAVIQQGNTNAAGSSDTRPGVLTVNDLTCFEPMRSIHASPQLQYPCAPATPYARGQQFTPDSIVTPGPLAFYKDAQAAAITAPVAAGAGFGLYITGTFSMFELTGGTLPAAGTVWTLRTYAGFINGGNGVGGGNTGKPYGFTQVLRPFTAVGARLQYVFNVSNTVSNPTSADLSKVHTVPDPYYVTNAYEQSTDNKVIKFVNLPRKAIIRIYSTSGILVTLIEHNSSTFGGEETWNVRNRNNQVVASGVYFYHIESNDGPNGTARRVGRMTIVNFAE